MAISQSQRVLIVVSYLDSSEKLLSFYNGIESLSIAFSKSILGSVYSAIYILKDENATKDKFISKLKSVGKKDSVKAIDVFMITHGYKERLVFYNPNDNPDPIDFTASKPMSEMMNIEHLSSGSGSDTKHEYKTKKLSEDIKELGIGVKLRLLYSTACYGKYHNADFINAGFCTSIGAKGVNTNAAVEFPIVLTGWAVGSSIESSIKTGQVGYQALDVIAKLAGWSTADSKKYISGRGSISIKSNP